MCGGGSEPLPAEPGAAADGAVTAARSPLRGAAMGGDDAPIHNIAAAAAAVHSAAAADSGCGDHHLQQPPPATVRGRQRWRRRWLLRRRMCLEGGGGGGGGLRGGGGSTPIGRRRDVRRFDASGWRRDESAERREQRSASGGTGRSGAAVAGSVEWSWACRRGASGRTRGPTRAPNASGRLGGADRAAERQWRGAGRGWCGD